MRTSATAMELRRLRRIVASAEQRIAGVVLAGKVHEIDTAGRRARLAIDTDDDGRPVLGPWAQWEEAATGLMTIHTPLKVGQQASYVSPSGVLGDGSTIRQRAFDDDTAAPSASADTAVIALGAARISIEGGSIVIEAGDIVLRGAVAAEGASLTHNGTNVGDDHTHTNVIPGPALSGPPA